MINRPRIPVLKTADVVEYWDAKVDRYESDLADGGTAALPWRSEVEIRLWERLLARTVGPPGARVLDVGTGTGFLALLMAQLGYEVTAVDTSANMLALVAARAERAGLSLTLHQGSAARLPFVDATFDAATCRLLLWLLLEPEVCVREWARCVRPGGKVVAIEYVHPNPSGGPVRRARRLLSRHADAPNSPFAAGTREQFPLWPARDATPYHNVFVRTGLERVLVEDLEALMLLKRQRATMSSRLRWPRTSHQYLIEGVVTPQGRRRSRRTTTSWPRSPTRARSSMTGSLPSPTSS